MAKPFNLTANLVIKATNLKEISRDVKTAVNNISSVIKIKVDSAQLKTLKSTLEQIRAMAAMSNNTIGIKVKAPTAKQIENLAFFAEVLRDVKPALVGVKSKELSFKVKAPTNKQIENVELSSLALKDANPIFAASTSKDINIRIRGLTQGRIDVINNARVALEQIQPVINSMGAGSNIAFKFTGLGGKRLTNFADGLKMISAQLTKTTPDLHRLNAVLSQKITHLGQFKKAAADAGQSLLGLGQNSNKIKSNINHTSSSVSQLGRATHEATSFMYRFGESGGIAVKRFGAFTVATSIVFGLVYAIGDAFKQAVEFEKQMAKIAQVSATTILGVGGISKSVTDLAVKYGIASKELLSISQVFAQAGLRGYDLQRALDAVAKSDLSPTFLNMENTAEGLIAVMGQFNIKANEFESVLGSINQVSADFAVESEDLVTAIRLFGSTFSNASKSTKGGKQQLKEMLALFTSIRAASRQTPESIATGLRTIITRIQRPRFIQFAKGYGIKLEDEEDQFIGVWEAVNRLAEGMDRLKTSSRDYRTMGQEIGGYRQVEKTINMLKQVQVARAALASADRGENSLDEQMGTQLETLSRRAQQVGEDFKRMIREIVATDTFKKMADIVLTAASAFIKLADAIKPILPLLAGLFAIRGTMGAVQFGRGALHSLMKGDTATGVGLKAVKAGGMFGFSGMGLGNIFNKGNVRQQLVQAGYFQSPPTTPITKKQRVSLSTQYAGQLSQNIFPNASQSTLNHFTPRFQQILSPVVSQLARVYGLGTRNFDVAMNGVIRELNRNASILKRGVGNFTNHYGGYNNAVSRLVHAGGIAARRDNRGRFGRGARIVGQTAANYSAALIGGGMMLETAATAYDKPVALGVAGRIMSGAGIGGMMGGPWGVAVGTLVGAVTGLADALGPEKIRRANEALAKELENINLRFADFEKTQLGDANFGVVIEDLKKAMTDAFNPDTIINDKKPGYFQDISDLFGDRESLRARRSNRTWYENALKTPAFSFGLPNLISQMFPERTANQGLDKTNKEAFNRASEAYQKLVPRSKESYNKLVEVMSKEGRIFKDNGEIDTTKVQQIKDKYNFDIQTLMENSVLGRKDSNTAIRNLAEINADRESGKDSSDKYTQRMKALVQATEAEAAELAPLKKSLDEMIFSFDNLRVSLQELSDVAEDAAEKNKMLAQTTDQYFERAMNGPATTKAIISPMQDMFKTPQAYSANELLGGLKKVGIDPNSQIARTIYAQSQLEKLMPNILAQARDKDVGNVDIKKELLKITTGENGVYKDFTGEQKGRVEDFIEGFFNKEGKAFSLSEDINKKDLFNRFTDVILGEDAKKGFEAASKNVELYNQYLERQVELASKRLELEQKSYMSLVELSRQAQGYGQRGRNLFYQEEPGQELQNFRRNRALNIGTIMGGRPFQDFNSLLNERDKAQQNRNIPEYEKYQGLINRQIDATKLLADKTEELSIIEKQVLQEQRKREMGRNLVDNLVDMDPMQRLRLNRGMMGALSIAAGGQLPQNPDPDYLKQVREAIDFLKANVSTQTGQQALEQLVSAPYYKQAVDRLGGPQGLDTAIAAGTAQGLGTEEQRLQAEFGNVANAAKQLGDILNALDVRQGFDALKAASFETAQSFKNLEIVRIRTNKVDIGVSGAPFTEDKLVPFEEEFAKGGKLGGSGPIPILAHGGELIIPKGKVNEGLAGVIDFAKKNGLTFAEGGIVPGDFISTRRSDPAKLRQLRNKFKQGIISEDYIIDPSTGKNVLNPVSNNPNGVLTGTVDRILDNSAELGVIDNFIANLEFYKNNFATQEKTSQDPIAKKQYNNALTYIQKFMKDNANELGNLRQATVGPDPFVVEPKKFKEKENGAFQKAQLEKRVGFEQEKRLRGGKAPLSQNEIDKILNPNINRKAIWEKSQAKSQGMQEGSLEWMLAVAKEQDRKGELFSGFSNNRVRQIKDKFKNEEDVKKFDQEFGRGSFVAKLGMLEKTDNGPNGESELIDFNNLETLEKRKNELIKKLDAAKQANNVGDIEHYNKNLSGIETLKGEAIERKRKQDLKDFYTQKSKDVRSGMVRGYDRESIDNLRKRLTDAMLLDGRYTPEMVDRKINEDYFNDEIDSFDVNNPNDIEKRKQLLKDAIESYSTSSTVNSEQSSRVERWKQLQGESLEDLKARNLANRRVIGNTTEVTNRRNLGNTRVNTNLLVPENIVEEPRSFDNLADLSKLPVDQLAKIRRLAEIPAQRAMLEERYGGRIQTVGELFLDNRFKTNEDIKRQRLEDAYYGRNSKYVIQKDTPRDVRRKYSAPQKSIEPIEKPNYTFEELRAINLAKRVQDEKDWQRQNTPVDMTGTFAPLITVRANSAENIEYRKPLGLVKGFDEGKLQVTGVEAARRAGIQRGVNREIEAKNTSKEFLDEGQELARMKQFRSKTIEEILANKKLTAMTGNGVLAPSNTNIARGIIGGGAGDIGANLDIPGNLLLNPANRRNIAGNAPQNNLPDFLNMRRQRVGNVIPDIDMVGFGEMQNRMRRGGAALPRPRRVRSREDIRRENDILSRTGQPLENPVRQKSIEEMIKDRNRMRKAVESGQGSPLPSGRKERTFEDIIAGRKLSEMRSGNNFTVDKDSDYELVDKVLSEIGNEFGVKTNIGKSRKITEEEQKNIAKAWNLPGVGGAYFYNQQQIGISPGKEVNLRILKHEYGHSIYNQKGIKNDPYVQEILKDANDFIANKHKNNPAIIGNKNYYLNPDETFSNILSSDAPDAQKYKTKLLDYLRSKENIQGFAGGTPLVNRSGLAEIHKGESILPARDITNFANAIRVATENLKGLKSGGGGNSGVDVGRSVIDEALIKAANTLSQINIPEKITLEFGTINHNINFNGNDALAQQVAKQVAEMTAQMVQRQLSSVMSMLTGEPRIG